MPSRQHRPGRRLFSRPRLFRLEGRTAPAVATFGGNAQHTSQAPVPSQALEAVHWSTPVDNFPTSRAAHYGGPVITDANTVIYPYRTGLNTPDFHIVARAGNDGATVWDVTTDWAPGPHGWYPPLQPVLATATGRVYYAGRGGTVYYRDNPDSPTGTVTQVAFFGTLAHYQANKSEYDSNVVIETPLTADAAGNIFFGFRVLGPNAANLSSGIARVTPGGAGTWVSAFNASGGDPNISRVAPNSAMALSNDGQTLYVGVRTFNSAYHARLLGLNSTTLATQYNSGILQDPRNGSGAGVLADSTASPMVAPDGKVFYGVFGNPYNGSRGWLLQFSGDLAVKYTPGAFGWDTTASLVPASMVPQYTGSSPYLIFTKYNNYYGISDGGDGSNGIAVLDPNDTEPEYHPSSNNLPVMKRVLYKVGPTADWDYPNVPMAVREWCINYGTVDPATSSILVNSADGKFYRWHLPTDTLSESLQLTNGIGQPYTMTVVAMDGSVFGIQIGKLFAMGRTPGLSVANVTANEAAGTVTFTVTLDYPRREAITVDYATADGSAVAGSDYTAKSGKLTFNPGEKTKTVTVTVASDALAEADETFFLNLSNASQAVIIDGQGQATIADDDPKPSISVADVSANEGNAGPSTITFTVSLSAASGQAVSVLYATADGSAVAPGDYVSAGGAVNFDPGQTSKTVTVQVNGDTGFEANETFFLNLSGPTNSTIADGQAQATIVNDDGVPSVAVGDVTVTEGGPAAFTVTLSNSSSQTITLNYATAVGSAGAGDFKAASGPMTFNPGQTSTTVTVNTTDDALNELTETFSLVLASPVNAFIADGAGQAALLDNDPEPTVSVGNASVFEGASGPAAMTFTVSLSAPSGRVVTVSYVTADDTALAASDYQAASGTVTFNPGETSKPVTVLVNGDTTDEPNETLFLNLSAPSGAAVAAGPGQGTIVNDDGLVLSVTDVAVAEGNSGSKLVTFTVTLSSKSGTAVTVNYATADGTATAAGKDYVAVSNTVTFNPGDTSKSFTVEVLGDGTNEADETFLVNLSAAVGATIGDGQAVGTITNDDPLPTLTIADLNVPEGDYNTATINVYVLLSAPSGQTVTVDYETSNGTASSTSALKDYIDTLGTVTFLPGETAKSFLVTVVADTIDELDETFFGHLLKATNATITDADNVATILDDDTSTVTVTDGGEVEGNSGTRAVSLVMYLSVPSDRTVQVMYMTEDDTATAPGDYVTACSAVTFAPGQTAQPFTVFINGDTADEPNERFKVNLYGATSGAYISDYESLVTISDDDVGPRVTSVKVNDGSAQRSRVTTVTVRFDSTVTLPADPATAFQLKRQGDNALAGLLATVVNTSVTEVTLTFTGPLSQFGSLADGRYTLTVFGGLVANGIGLLDGNGDGLGGDDFTATLHRLFGDADGDGDVDAVDYSAFRGAFGTPSFALDFDGDGDADAADFAAFRARFGTSV